MVLLHGRFPFWRDEMIRCLSIFLLISMHITNVNCGVAEKRLLRYLFNYSRNDAHNKLERPVDNDSSSLIIRLKVTLQQIIDVDEKNQILNSNLWLDMQWNDYHFKWDPAKYDNITSIVIPPHSIWRPDILMYNSADDKFDGTYPTNVIISNDGDVSYIPPGLFKSTCQIKITWFPFDRQTCKLKFGSWTYHAAYIDLRLQCANESSCMEFGEGDTTTFIENGEWDLVGLPAKRNVIKYDCCDETYLDITFAVQIRRRSLYYTFNLIVPCILISTMALLVFTLPPDAGEKISLGVTIMLSLTMFLLMVADAMPQTSGAVPLIGMYFSCIMIMCSFSVVFTVLVLNYHHRSSDGEEIPLWIHKFINGWLANILFMRRRTGPPPEPTGEESSQKHSNRRHQSKQKTNHFNSQGTNYSRGDAKSHKSDYELKDRSSRSLLANVLQLDDNFRVKSISPPNQFACQQPLIYSNIPSPSYHDVINAEISQLNAGQYLQQSASSHDAYAHSNNTSRVNYPPPDSPILSPPSIPPPLFQEENAGGTCCNTKMELYQIIRELRCMTEKIKSDEENNTRANEWKFAARVIDRFCLIMFTVFTLTSSCAILLQPVDEGFENLK